MYSIKIKKLKNYFCTRYKEAQVTVRTILRLHGLLVVVFDFEMKLTTTVLVRYRNLLHR